MANSDVNDMTGRKGFAPGDPERMREISARALERIASLGLTPVPHVYELWFRYFQGSVEVVRAVDTYAGALDETACHQLYKRHLSEAARDDAVRKISEQVQQAIGELAATVSAVQTQTKEYSHNLQDVSQKIQTATSLEDLGTVVTNIVQNTKAMVQKNQELEVQLTSSSSQVSELKKNLDNVKREALTDGLTGLANRKAFDKQILEWTEDCARDGKQMCLLMLDIDHFKSFNDTYGHQTGDQVLRLVARELTDGVKGRDFAARFGGEEFAIMLPETPLAGAQRVAEALRKAVEAKEVVNKANNQKLGRITLSIGIAEFASGETVLDFIDRADTALYSAKRGGRNQVRAAEPPVSASESSGSSTSH